MAGPSRGAPASTASRIAVAAEVLSVSDVRRACSGDQGRGSGSSGRRSSERSARASGGASRIAAHRPASRARPTPVAAAATAASAVGPAAARVNQAFTFNRLGVTYIAATLAGGV